MTVEELIVAVAAMYVAVSFTGYCLMMKRYPLETCGRCKATPGKDYIPPWLAVLTWTRGKAFRPCPDCGGTPPQKRRWFGLF